MKALGTVIVAVAIFFLMEHVIFKPPVKELAVPMQVSSVPPIQKKDKSKEEDRIEIKEKKVSFKEKLNKNGPELRFDMHGKFKNDHLYQGHVEIFNTSNSKRIQKLIINKNYADAHFEWDIENFEFNGHQVQLVDINFDGYLDLRFLDNEGATGNNWYASYLYDPKRGKYIFNRQMSSQSGLAVDSKNKQLLTYNRCGACLEFIKYYKYLKGHYILSKIEWTEMDTTKEPDCFKITGIPKVRDIVINEGRMCDPAFSDYIEKRVKILKREGLVGSLDGRQRGVLGNVD